MLCTLPIVFSQNHPVVSGRQKRSQSYQSPLRTSASDALRAAFQNSSCFESQTHHADAQQQPEHHLLPHSCPANRSAIFKRTDPVTCLSSSFCFCLGRSLPVST